MKFVETCMQQDGLNTITENKCYYRHGSKVLVDSDDFTEIQFKQTNTTTRSQFFLSMGFILYYFIVTIVNILLLVMLEIDDKRHGIDESDVKQPRAVV